MLTGVNHHMNINKYFLIVGLVFGSAINSAVPADTQAMLARQGADVLFAAGAAMPESFATGQAVTDPYALRLMMQDKIDKHTQKIGRTIRLHSFIRTTAKLGGAAIALYVLYRTVQSWRQDGKPIILPAAVATTAPVPLMTQEEGLALRKMFNETHPSWFTFQWWKNNALWLANSVGLSVGLSFGGTVVNRYAHEDNIEWFVAQNTKIKELADELRGYHDKTLIKNELREFTAQDLSFHCVTLAGMARDLVEQAESVAGFMEYRLSYFKGQGVILLPNEFLQPTRLVASVNAFVRSLQQQLPAQGEDTVEQVKKVCGLIMQCATDIQQIVNRFQGIEYSIQWRIINGG